MKIIFDFDENENRNFASRLIKREDAFSLLWELDNLCRDKLKHGHTYKTPDEVLEHIRQEILESGLLDLWD